MNTLKVILETQGDNLKSFMDWVKYLLPTISALVVVAIGGWVNYRIASKTLKAKKNEPEIQEIRDSLKTVYKPLLLLLRKNKLLTDIFKANKGGESFRTLPALLKGEAFHGNDEKLLCEIIEIDQEINKIILSEKGKIKDDKISEELAKASAHFEVIKLAHAKNIIGEPERFKDLVFPRGIEKKIDDEIRKLEERLIELEKE